MPVALDEKEMEHVLDQVAEKRLASLKYMLEQARKRGEQPAATNEEEFLAGHALFKSSKRLESLSERLNCFTLVLAVLTTLLLIATMLLATKAT